MMRIFSMMLLIAASGISAAADPYTLFKEKDKIGIKDDAGKVIIPASFDALGWSDGSFSVTEGVTGYKLDNHWGLINLKKEFLSKADYESLTYPGGDRVIARKKINAVESRTGCLNLRGEVTVAFAYDGISISGLRAIVFRKEKTSYFFGLTDLDGKEIIPLSYTAIRPLGTLRYAIENTNHKTALFSEQGKPVTDFTIDSISSFYYNYAVIYQGHKQGAIDRDGQIKVAPEYAAIKFEQDGALLGKLPDEWKILDGENHEVRTVEASMLTPMTHELYDISQQDLHGIADRKFNILLPVEYDHLGKLQDGMLLAVQRGKYGIIRITGKIVIPLEFDSLIREGRLARVRKKSAWSLYDTLAVKKTLRDYDFIGPFNGNFFPAKKNGFWGGIDRYGKESIQCVFDSLLQVSNDQVAVKFKGAFGIIATAEKWMLMPQPLRIELLSSDRYLQYDGNNIFLKDFDGHDIYFTENKIELHQDYFTEISNDGSEKRIDFQGRIIERGGVAQVENAQQTFAESEGLTGILKDGKYGFVDARGRLRIANRYDGIGKFQEGLAAVKIISKWGFINAVEKIVVQPVYDQVTPFSSGTAVVKRGGFYGSIDKMGRLILICRYDSIVRLPGDHYLLKAGTQYGLADKNGQVLLDTKYDKLDNTENGYCIIQRNGKFGLLTLQGLSTIPLQYDQLKYDREKNEYLALIIRPWQKIAAP